MAESQTTQASVQDPINPSKDNQNKEKEEERGKGGDVKAVESSEDFIADQRPQQWATSSHTRTAAETFSQLEKQRRAANIVSEGSRFILFSHKSGRIFGKAVKDSVVRIGKDRAKVDGMIGHPFGSFFMVDEGSLVKTDQREEEELAPTDSDFVPTANNSNLFDDSKNQKLTPEEIASLKEQKGAEELVKIIAQNSATFDSKTEFSQEKYLRKKKRKYIPIVQCLQPTANNVCEAYFESWPKKALFLRVDTLALLLTYANVRANSNVLVVDNCAGILTAAVAERLSGFGNILVGHMGTNPPTEGLRCCNLPASFTDIIYNFHLEIVEEALQSIATASSGVGDSAPVPSATVPAISPELKRDVKMPPQHSKNAQVLQLLQNKMDSLVVAARYSPLHVLSGLLPLLAPAASFAVYCQNVEPLSECFDELKKNKSAVNMQVIDVFYREHQIQPNRTHPHVRMSGSGGYILIGNLTETVCTDLAAKRRKFS